MSFDTVKQYLKRWQIELLVVLSAAMITFAYYGSTLKLGFFSDDWHQLSVTASHASSVWSYFLTNIIGERGGSSYGPVFNLLLSIEYRLFGWTPLGYHLVSLALYVATSFCLFLLGRKMTGQAMVGFLAAIVFVVVPSHTEAVAWVAVQTHLLATFFFVLSLYWYVRGARDNLLRYRYAALGAMALSLFTKEIGITFLALWLIIEWFFSARSWKDRAYWRDLILFALTTVGVVLLYWFLRQYTTGYGAGYYGQTSLVPAWRAMAAMAIELTATIILPYPHRRDLLNWFMAHEWVLWFSGAGLTAMVAFWWQRYQTIVVTGVLYSISLVPFLPLLLHPFSSEGERYAYLPSVFFALLAAMIVFEFKRRFAVSRGAITLVVVMLYTALWTVQTQKIMPWRVADVVTERVLASVVALDIRPTDHVVFIGLPDHVSGAQVFRNAIKEAVRARHGMHISGERIPIYAALTSSRALSTTYTLIPVSSTTLRLVSDQPSNPAMFTGFRTFEGEVGQFTLEGWERGDRGRSILMRFDPEALDEIVTAGGRVVVVYYSNGALRSHVLQSAY